MYRNNTEKFLIWFLFALTIAITLAPFFTIGFTTADDIENYVSYINDTVFRDSLKFAKHAGRFYFILTKPLYSLPYIGDSFTITRIIQYSSLLLSYLLFSILAKKFFNSKELGCILFLLLVLATPISANYFLPFIAYPFYFTFSFSLVLISFLLYMNYTESNKYKLLIISSIIFFIAILFYETYLIFLLFLCGFILARNISKSGSILKLFKNKSFYKEIIPVISVGVLYVIIYFIFRLCLGSADNAYAGSSFAKEFSINNYFVILIQLTKTVLPLNIYHLSEDIIIKNSFLPEGHINSFWYILKNSGLNAIINSLTQILLFVYFSIRLKNNISFKKIISGILIAFLFAISAHSILGMSEKYNTVEYSSISGYVTSFYSYFGVWLIILLLSYLFIKLSYNKKYVKFAVIGIFSLCIGYVSIMNNYSNMHLSRAWELNQIHFNVMNDLIDEGAFDEIEDNAIVFAPEVYKSKGIGDVIFIQSFNWGRYVRIKSGKDLSIIRTPEKFQEVVSKNTDKKIYRLIKIQTQKNTDLMYVICEVNRETIDFTNNKNLFKSSTCNKANIYYYSANKNFLLNFQSIGSENKFLRINNSDIISLREGFNQININNINLNNKISSFFIESDSEIYTERFSISNMIPLYSRRVNIFEDKNLLYEQDMKFDCPIVVDSTKKYPKSFLDGLSIEELYSTIIISVNMDVEIQHKDKGFQIVVEIKDDDGHVILWESQEFKDVKEINFMKVIDLNELKESNPKSMKMYIWNPLGCDFTIKNINNSSVKII